MNESQTDERSWRVGHQGRDDGDAERLIEIAGGLSPEECGWSGCEQRALTGKRLCVRHAYRDAW